MNSLDLFNNTNIISKQLAKNRGTPLNFFLSPYIERYFKQLETQLGIPEGPLGGNSLGEENPLANAIRGGMNSGSNMEPTNY